MLDRENIIKQIEANIRYYSTHCPDDQQGYHGYEYALTSVEALKEILSQAEKYDEAHDVLAHPLTDEELKHFKKL